MARHISMASRRGPGPLISLSVLAALTLAASAQAQTREQRLSLPIQPPPFEGTVAATPSGSKPHWQAEVSAPRDAPNILLVMTDDVGFAAGSTFGGPIPTPALDNLARQGLKYNRFHTTGVCSPSRAALLTGRNHHAVGAGTLVNNPSGFPGYNGKIPDSAATIARVLTANGYNTAMFGKHHNVVSWQESAAGPFGQWPTGLGFEYFFGFMGGDTDQWHPVLYRDQTRIEADPGDGDKLLDERVSDDVIRWLHNQNAAGPDKPFFIYLAPGSTHAPHQAPREWIDRFRGKFDQGWDKLREQIFAEQRRSGVIPANAKLTPRPAQIRAWNSLSAQEKRVYARMMEVYAGMLAFQDAQIARILNEIDRMGLGDNTLVVFIQGDNGGSAQAGNLGTLNEIGGIANRVREDTAWFEANLDHMGTSRTSQALPVGWSWATNTPFQWTKHLASHLGGIRNGMVVRWPERITAKGETRTQFSHLIDIMPTLLDVAGLPAPETVNGVAQQRIDGVSLKSTFTGTTPLNRTQYFEIMDNAAIYKDGWMASTYPTHMPWERVHPSDNDETDRTWELYDLNSDFSQATNLAEREPAKLEELKTLFHDEAVRNQVYPMAGFSFDTRAPAAVSSTRTTFSYWGSDVSVMLGAAPSFAGRSFTVTADVTIGQPGENGVLLAAGSWFGGWSFYLRDGRPAVVHAVSRRPEDIFSVAATQTLSPGDHRISFEFTSDGGAYAGGTMRILANGSPVGKGRIGRTILVPAGLGETFDIGRDTGVPVTANYAPSTISRETISRVTVELKPVTPAR